MLRFSYNPMCADELIEIFVIHPITFSDTKRGEFTRADIPVDRERVYFEDRGNISDS